MAKTESVVKSFRVSEAQFDEANEIFRKEGFSFSEVIKLLLEATITEGRIPRSLGNKATEDMSDKAVLRENYVDRILDTVLSNPELDGMTAEERLLHRIFGQQDIDAKHMTNTALKDWGKRWGLPDDLSVATLADLHDSELFAHGQNGSVDPWDGEYTYWADLPAEPSTEHVCNNFLKFRDNLRDNLDQVRRKMEIRAINTLMEGENAQEDDDYE